MTPLADLFTEVAIKAFVKIGKNIANAPDSFAYSPYMPDGRYFVIGRTILVRDRANANAFIGALNRYTDKVAQENRRRIYGGSVPGDDGAVLDREGGSG